jgi:hypothetical protein
MNRKDQSLTDTIARDLKKGYWKASDAARYAPMLFPFVKPQEAVRQAVSAICCHEEKDQRMKALKYFVHKEREGQVFLKDFERILATDKDRLLAGQDSKEDTRNYRDIIMMLLATNFASQKSTLTVSIDLSNLYQEVYKGCDQCKFEKSCGGASSVVTEYIVSALGALNVSL